jgi:predicted nucleic acid-binding protein
VGRLSYLIDSNVWLELLLRQQHADEVRQFLEMVQSDEISLTEFTLYSIGIITSRLKKEDVFAAFLSDLLEETGIKRIALSLADLRDLLSAMREQDLDFDDAYQYVAARNNDLILVSFDKDFDSTNIQRKTPANDHGRKSRL